MKLGEADASGRRSPVATGEYVDIPCDLVISAVGEQVDSALLTSNGVEVDGKDRPPSVPMWRACTPPVTPAVAPLRWWRGIADAAQFAEAVIGAPHTYDIPQQAYITKADAIAKKGILRMSGCTACGVSAASSAPPSAKTAPTPAPTGPTWSLPWPTAATRSCTWIKCATSAATAPSSAPTTRALPR